MVFQKNIPSLLEQEDKRAESGKEDNVKATFATLLLSSLIQLTISFFEVFILEYHVKTVE